ncbi:MAG TPA: hypothetical protein VGO47_10890, partial [Chlamydiales bacterium]|nr:hypothetical protein [Chlamydiales bacterium]
IDQPVFGLYIAPLDGTNDYGQGETVGEISFGGPDSARFNGSSRDMRLFEKRPLVNLLLVLFVVF